jgi:D-tyrosyl-tRNA(Tyr) deacylase
MRAVVQRVASARVDVKGQTVGEIGNGLLALVGVADTDTQRDADWMADRIAGLRIFDDPDGKMNLSVKEVGGAVLAVSQFTLLGDCRKGRRPSYVKAAVPEQAESLYQRFLEQLRSKELVVATGAFRTTMRVSLVNDGPVTLLLDSTKLF